MLLQTKKCLKDNKFVDKNFINVGKYRIPKNSDYKKINPIIMKYIFKVANNPEDAVIQFNDYCSNLQIKDCIQPCSTVGNKWLLSERCGYKELKSIKKITNTILESSRRYSLTKILSDNYEIILKFFGGGATYYLFELFDIFLYLNKFNFFGPIHIGLYKGLTYIFHPRIMRNRVVFAIIIGPIIEEIVYRGIGSVLEKQILSLMDYIKNQFPKNADNIETIKIATSIFIKFMVATFFGLTHIGNYNLMTRDKFSVLFQVINSFFAGILLESIRSKFGLHYSILFHILNNFYSCFNVNSFITSFFALYSYLTREENINEHILNSIQIKSKKIKSKSKSNSIYKKITKTRKRRSKSKKSRVKN
jgi:hypothetical protein